jgi:transposase-like protein
VLDKFPKRQQVGGTALLRQIPAAPTRREAERRRDQFVAWCGEHGYADAARCLMADWERLVPFYSFPQPHWHHMRTSNPVELPSAMAQTMSKTPRLVSPPAKTRPERLQRCRSLLF